MDGLPFAADGPPPDGSGADVPWAVSGEPIVAVKLARLRLRRGSVVLAPLYLRRPGPGWYPVAADAVCESRRPHPAPALTCTCGFWAVHGPDGFDRAGGWTADRIAVDVALGGVIVEHDHGWRAGQQRVEALAVPDGCWRCGRPTVAVARRSHRVLWPVCVRHARRRLRVRRAGVRSLAAVQSDLGVPLRCSPRPGADVVAAGRARRSAAAVPIVAAVAICLVAALTGSSVVAATGSMGLWCWPIMATRADRHGEARDAFARGALAGTIVAAIVVGLVGAGLGGSGP